jgi:exodeoxyribonuclease VII large subunit
MPKSKINKNQSSLFGESFLISPKKEKRVKKSKPRPKPKITPKKDPLAAKIRQWQKSKINIQVDGKDVKPRRSRATVATTLNLKKTKEIKKEAKVEKKKKKPLTVSEFIGVANDNLAKLFVRVKGEIGRVQDRGNYVFFTLKDSKDEANLNCFSWKNVVKVCSVDLEEGLEVVLSGYAEIYKRTGTLSFQVKSIELVGEGVLKKAFEDLKEKLEKEGLFDEAIKKSIPLFPKRVALITSKHGEAINDFNTNIGNFGFKIDFLDSRVEGQRAVFDLIEGIKFFNNKKRFKNYDALILVRGGGSWESLQAFNNETLAREIRKSKIPIISGVGHEGDITICDLVADFRASTPTGAAKKLSENWLRTRDQLLNFENQILNGFKYQLETTNQEIRAYSESLKQGFTSIFDNFNELKVKFKDNFNLLFYETEKIKGNLESYQITIKDKFGYFLLNTQDLIQNAESIIKANNPERQLKLGYNIAFKKGQVVKSTQKIQTGNELDLRFYDGEVKSKVLNKKAKK